MSMPRKTWGCLLGILLALAGSLSPGQADSYDANGNLTARPGQTFVYDAENRLQTVTANGQTTTYIYDGDGQRVKKVQGGQTTVYIGNYYEKNVSTGGVTTYYYANGQRIAMRQGSTVYYFTGDHLGSTSLVTGASGNEVARQKYFPFGAPRAPNPSTLPTDYKFTGQRSEEAALGSLYDYNARFYSPVLGRFLSPDSLIPQPGNPQALNRYSYTLNNPLKYTDTTGHWVESAFDAISLGLTLNDIRNEGFTFWNAVSLVTDVAAVALPVVPAGASHAIRAGKAAAKVMNAVDTAGDAAKVVGQLDNVADAVKALPSNPCSFDAGTPVLTPGGLLPIQSLVAGDLVLAYNETNGMTGVYTVTHRLTHLDPVTVLLTVGGETIATTPEHPFFTMGGGWTPAGELVTGDLVRRAAGSFGAVDAVRLVVRPALMYNLTVAEAHTFFVGEAGWLVHNTCPILGKAQVTKDPTHASRSQAQAAHLSNQPDVAEVHLNRTLGSATGGQVKSGMRPNVTAKYMDGSYRLYEYVSSSQSLKSQHTKVQKMEQLLQKAGISTRPGVVRR